MIKPADSHYVRVQQYDTHYITFGQGPAVVLIHAFGGFAELWNNSLPILGREFRVYALDLPGFGRSEKPQRFPFDSYKDMAQFVIDFLDVIGEKSTILIGHSMGGGVALQCALSHPKRVSRVIVANSTGLGREVIWLWRIGLLPIVGELFVRPSKLSMYAFLATMIYNRSIISRQLIDLIVEIYSLQGSIRNVLECGRKAVNLKGQRIVLQELPRIAMPVLLIGGNNDRMVPLHHIKTATNQIPLAESCILADCGHIPFIEQPEAFHSTVLDFLHRVESS